MIEQNVVLIGIRHQVIKHFSSQSREENHSRRRRKRKGSKANPERKPRFKMGVGCDSLQVSKSHILQTVNWGTDYHEHEQTGLETLG